MRGGVFRIIIIMFPLIPQVDGNTSECAVGNIRSNAIDFSKTPSRGSFSCNLKSAHLSGNSWFEKAVDSFQVLSSTNLSSQWMPPKMSSRRERLTRVSIRSEDRGFVFCLI